MIYKTVTHPNGAIETIAKPEAPELAANKLISERYWRNAELRLTDIESLLIDYPNKSALTIYRQLLRDYPSTPDFALSNRPVKP